MESKNKVKAAFFLFILVVFMVGGFILMEQSYSKTDKKTVNIAKEEEKKDIRLDTTKEYIYFEDSNRVVDELDIEYKTIVLNFNDENEIAQILNSETASLTKSVEYDKEDETLGYDGLIKASYKIYNVISYDNYLSLTVDYYNFNKDDLVSYEKSKAYVFDKYTACLYTNEELLEKFNLTLDDVKAKIKTHLEDQDLIKEENIAVEDTLNNLNDMSLFIDKLGKLSISILVKNDVKDYNDVVILN